MQCSSYLKKLTHDITKIEIKQNQPLLCLFFFHFIWNCYKTVFVEITSWSSKYVGQCVNTRGKDMKN